MSNWNTSPPSTAVSAMPASPAPVAYQPQVVSIVGGACPSCFGGLYTNTFSFWHVTIALCMFPIGLLVFLAPVKRCQCGTRYGAGKTILAAAKFASAVFAIGALCALAFVVSFQRHIH